MLKVNLKTYNRTYFQLFTDKYLYLPYCYKYIQVTKIYILK